MPGTATCELCGGPTRRGSKYGVCVRHGSCKREYNRRYHAANREKINQRRWLAADPESARATCELCGEPILRNNKQGVCKRQPDCRLENRRRWYAANREKINEHRRRWVAANRERTKEYARRHYATNREKCKEYRAANRENTRETMRLWRAANREKIRETMRLWREGNREKVNKTQRRWMAANRERAKENKRRWYAANHEKKNAQERARRALAGRIPTHKKKGHLAPNWSGGMMMPCDVPGCHRMAGWRRPSRIKRNKAGFRCPVHRHVRLPQIKESDYEYEGLEALRSSVA